MKKKLVVALALSMALSLCACGGSASESGTGAKEEAVSASEQENDKEEDVDVVESEESKESITAGSTEDSAEMSAENVSKSDSNDINFQSTVLVDNDECAITIKEIDPNDAWGYTLKAMLENKSSEKTYMFSVESAYVNGVSADPLFATTVAAGKKANENITFMNDSLEKAGITDFTDIELRFRVYNDNGEEDPIVNDTFHIYPYGEDKAEKYVRTPADTDNVLVDDDHVSVIVTGYSEDEFGDYNVELYLVNKTDNSVMYSVDNASINGIMADPFYACELAANKCAFSTISWTKDILEENGIETVEEIELPFKAYENDEINFDGETYVEEVFTLNP